MWDGIKKRFNFFFRVIFFSVVFPNSICAFSENYIVIKVNSTVVSAYDVKIFTVASDLYNSKKCLNKNTWQSFEKTYAFVNQAIVLQDINHLKVEPDKSTLKKRDEIMLETLSLVEKKCLTQWNISERYYKNFITQTMAVDWYLRRRLEIEIAVYPIEIAQYIRKEFPSENATPSIQQKVEKILKQQKFDKKKNTFLKELRTRATIQKIASIPLER